MELIEKRASIGGIVFTPPLEPAVKGPEAVQPRRLNRWVFLARLPRSSRRENLKGPAEANGRGAVTCVG
jgi:hypothetical protein